MKEKFYNLIGKAVFLPNSPTSMNAGRKDGLLSACFVLPLFDSLKEILKTVMNTGLIQEAGGGTSGPISFGGILAEDLCVIMGAPNGVRIHPVYNLS